MDNDDINAAPTTLVTFLYENLQARAVDLLGSWDNFTKAYPMRLDARRGGDQWVGCYTFDDITFDGEAFVAGGVRSGGLKMGGTYWYYYSVDCGAIETYNEAEPYSTQCPLLPGQRVNVLEVPYEYPSTTQGQSTGNTDSAQTLDPQDRYINPRPAPRPKANIPRLITSAADDAMASRLRPKLYALRQSPVTAGGYVSQQPKPAQNAASRTRAAAGPSMSNVKSALAFLKGLDATSPGELGRNGTRPWPRRALPPSSGTSDADSVGRSPSQTSPTPRSVTSKRQSRRAEPRQQLGVAAAHKRHASSSPVASPKLVEAPFHARSVSLDDAASRRVQHQHSYRTDSTQHYPPRGSSRNYAGVSAGTRSPYSGSDHTQGPYSPTYADDGKESRSAVTAFGSSHTGQNVLRSTGSSASGLALDKELPPLPAYLIPNPLNIRPKHEEQHFEDRSPASTTGVEHKLQSRFSEWTINQSRFSEWTVHSLDNEEALDSDTDDSDPEMSPTFSSVHAESSLDAMTPRRLSDHASPSLEEQMHPFAPCEVDDYEEDDTHRPDLYALQQLREAINNSTLPSHNTFRPLSASSLPRNADEHGLDFDALSGLAELTPTATTFKRHDGMVVARDPLVAGESTTLMAELLTEFDYLGDILS